MAQVLTETSAERIRRAEEALDQAWVALQTDEVSGLVLRPLLAKALEQLAQCVDMLKGGEAGACASAPANWSTLEITKPSKAPHGPPEVVTLTKVDEEGQATDQGDWKALKLSVPNGLHGKPKVWTITRVQ